MKASAGMPVGDGGGAYRAPRTALDPGGMGREGAIPVLSNEVGPAGSPVEPEQFRGAPVQPDAAGMIQSQTPGGDPEGAPAGFPEPQPYLEAARGLAGDGAELVKTPPETPGLETLRLIAEKGTVSEAGAGRSFDGAGSRRPGTDEGAAVHSAQLRGPEGKAAGTAAGGPSALSQETDQLDDIDALVEFVGNFHNAAARAFPQAGFSKPDYDAYAKHLLLALRDEKPPKPALREGARKIYRERLADGSQRAEFDRIFEEMLAKLRLKTYPDASSGTGTTTDNLRKPLSAD